MKLDGFILAMAIRPGWRQTRRNSKATFSGRGAKMAANADITTSNSSSPNGSASASPSRNSMSSFSARARCAAWVSRFGAMSTAVTCAPLRAAGNDWLPGPAAHVEDLCAGSKPEALDKRNARFLVVAGNLAEVSSHPRGFRHLLEVLKRGCSSRHGSRLLPQRDVCELRKERKILRPFDGIGDKAMQKCTLCV